MAVDNPQYNTFLWNGTEWNGTSPDLLEPTAPVATISAPLAPPPQQFTNASTLINGGYKEAGLLIFRNGLFMTEGSDYTRDGGIVTFVAPPQAGDILTARVFVIGKALGGPTPERYVAPWTLPVTGARDGVALQYEVLFPPTIIGGCDGINPLFQWGVALDRVQIFRNGLMMTFGEDIAIAGPYAASFLPGAVPQAGDLITILGY